MEDATEQPVVQKSHTMRNIVLGLLAVIGVLAVWNTATGDSGMSGGVREQSARLACHDFVRDDLRAPSTADFERQATISVSGGTYTVRGIVDAENGFGASVRAGYSCVVSDTGDGWRLVNLVLR